MGDAELPILDKENIQPESSQDTVVPAYFEEIEIPAASNMPAIITSYLKIRNVLPEPELSVD